MALPAFVAPVLGLLTKLAGALLKAVPLFVAYLAGQRAAKAKATQAALDDARAMLDAGAEAPRTREDTVDRLRSRGL